MKMNKPVIGITMGDPVGIGPEIIVKSMEHEQIFKDSHPIVIGDAKVLQRLITSLNVDLEVHVITEDSEYTAEHGKIMCIDLDIVPDDLPFGQLSSVAGDASFQYVKKAIALAESGQIDAICTAPLSKEAMHKAGHMYPGHTEILAELTGTKDYSMMLSSPNLKVIHVTTHVGLIEAIELINPERVHTVIQLAHTTLTEMGIENPRIGVCGINPHAGENGLFGNNEEEEKVVPAIQQAVKEGIDVTGPHPADTLFYLAQRGDFDMVIAMYHDQGHIPIKVLGLESGVNITVGLPVIRTSVDHGTAFDIAGKGIAEEGSLIEAINQAIDFVQLRN